MTLRRKLLLRYMVIVAACVLLLMGHVHHVFVAEHGTGTDLLLTTQAARPWGDYAELVFHGGILFVLGAGWWMMRRTLKPIYELAAVVEKVSADDLGQLLPRVDAGDEVDRFTAAFNHMAQRLDRAFQHARQFAMNASHELKTPLAVMRSGFEDALREDPVPACRACASARLAEIARLSRMVDALTLLSKADIGMVSLEKKPVPLHELVLECYEDTKVLGSAARITVTLSHCENAVITGDRHWLRQLLLNLADNATSYNEENGTIMLALRNTGEWAEITMSNTGPGILPELLDRVFERFVRGPEARARFAEGCGLGLSICQWVAQAHGGTIELTSAPGRLTVATVRLPLSVE